MTTFDQILSILTQILEFAQVFQVIINLIMSLVQ